MKSIMNFAAKSLIALFGATMLMGFTSIVNADNSNHRPE